MQKWLARLSFSFIILAAVLFWQAYHLLGQQHPAQRWRVVLYCAGAAVLTALGAAGVRARHRDSS